MRRREVKRRLAGSVASLNSYCQEPAIKQATSWPSGDFLESVEEDVGSLSATNHVSWKTFHRLSARMPSLRLALRLDNLANRALARLRSAPHASLGRARQLIRWLVRMRYQRLTELIAVNRASAAAVKRQTRLDKDARLEKQRKSARLRKQRERIKKSLTRNRDISGLR
jgi:hypothetical protein